MGQLGGGEIRATKGGPGTQGGHLPNPAEDVCQSALPFQSPGWTCSLYSLNLGPMKGSWRGRPALQKAWTPSRKQSVPSRAGHRALLLPLPSSSERLHPPLTEGLPCYGFSRSLSRYNSDKQERPRRVSDSHFSQGHTARGAELKAFDLRS